MNTIKKNIPQLTGVRGLIAFLIAYIWHWYLLFGVIPFPNNPIIKHLFDSLGSLYFYIPDVFFVISGYLIQRGSSKRITEQGMSFFDFIMPKVKKLYPIMIVTTCITFVLQQIGLYLFGYYPLHNDGGEIRNSLLSLILSVFGLQSGYISDNDTRAINGPTWFVAILVLCYVIYYFVTKYIKGKYLRYFVYLLFVIGGLFLLENPVNTFFMYSVNARGYIGFFMGVLMAIFSIHIENISEDEVTRKKINLLSYGYVLIIFSFVVYLQQTQQLIHNNCIVCLLIWPGFVYLVIHGFVLSRILSLNIFLFLGKISMPIFLCNFPTDVAIRLCDICFKLELDYSNQWLWFFHVVISLIIAYFFHVVFEVGLKKKN